VDTKDPFGRSICLQFSPTEGRFDEDENGLGTFRQKKCASASLHKRHLLPPIPQVMRHTSIDKCMMVSKKLLSAVEWPKLLIVIVDHEIRALKFAKIGVKMLTWCMPDTSWELRRLHPKMSKAGQS
jgi:hypothetical protein